MRKYFSTTIFFYLTYYLKLMAAGMECQKWSEWSRCMDLAGGADIFRAEMNLLGCTVSLCLCLKGNEFIHYQVCIKSTL